MPIHLIRTPATAEQIADMLQAFGDFIKLAVDVERIARHLLEQP